MSRKEVTLTLSASLGKLDLRVNIAVSDGIKPPAENKPQSTRYQDNEMLSDGERYEESYSICTWSAGGRAFGILA